MEQRLGLDRNVLRLTTGDPRGAKQHWNTGAKENQQLNPGGPIKEGSKVINRDWVKH